MYIHTCRRDRSEDARRGSILHCNRAAFYRNIIEQLVIAKYAMGQAVGIVRVVNWDYRRVILLRRVHDAHYFLLIRWYIIDAGGCNLDSRRSNLRGSRQASALSLHTAGCHIDAPQYIFIITEGEAASVALIHESCWVHHIIRDDGQIKITLA